jgi:hypothetical protein
MTVPPAATHGAWTPEGEVPPATRLAAEQVTMRNPLYARERDRLLQARKR